VVSEHLETHLEPKYGWSCVVWCGVCVHAHHLVKNVESLAKA